MCLNTYKFEVKTAEEDITVYKTTMKLSKNNFRTPFRSAVVLFNEVLKEKDFKTELDEYEKVLQNYSINRGFHSLLTFKDAKELKNEINESLLIITECVIPKGSLYIKGDFQRGTTIYKSIASDQIIYKREVTSFKLWKEKLILKLKKLCNLK